MKCSTAPLTLFRPTKSPFGNAIRLYYNARCVFFMQCLLFMHLNHSTTIPFMQYYYDNVTWAYYKLRH
uniref:Uncharacterized protein n=1 Tax=Arundo donax TaxID=35708 RepID=A0A0A9BXK5_ARUDO